MGESNIFIASSHTAKRLAQNLADKISIYGNADDVKLSPIRWWEISASDFILNSVRKEMKKCDFAAVLLTQNDLDMRPTQKGLQDATKDRDAKKTLHYNPIFEAGLFIGDVDDHERCFVVTTCNKAELPSDLDGLIYIHVSNDDTESIAAAARDIYEKAKKFAVLGQLRAVRGLKRATYAMDEIYQRETVIGNGGNLTPNGALVFVNTPEPLEMHDANFASRVVENILKYKIQYTYVYRESKNLETMGAGIAAIFKAIKKYDRVLLHKKLAAVSRNLNIYFASFYGGLEFCIHDAESEDRAKCYMRCRHQGATSGHDFWIDWVENQQAAKFVKLISLIKLPDENSKRRIFHNTSEVTVLTDEYRTLTKIGADLKKSIDEAIDDLEDEVKFTPDEKKDIMKACFYGIEA